MGYSNNRIFLDEFHNLPLPAGFSTTVIITDPKGELVSMFEHTCDFDAYEDLVNMYRTECL